jgi:serine/threonine protein kinase
MYRDIGIVRSHGQVRGDKLLFIEMEFIPYTFEKLVDERVLTPAMLRGILIKISEALAYFGNTYSFFHRDFHMGNLMMGTNGIKIIDFGMSCCAYEGESYGMPDSAPVPAKVSQAMGFGSGSCASIDLMIFLMSIRDHLEEEYNEKESRGEDNTFEATICDYIDEYTKLSNGNIVYDLLKWYTDNYERGSAVWHSCYYWQLPRMDTIKLEKGSKLSMLDAFLGVKVFLPSQVHEIFDSDYSATGYGLSSLPFVGSYLRPLRSPVKKVMSLVGKESSSPNSNVTVAISRLRTLGGRRKTRRASRKTRKGRRKH